MVCLHSLLHHVARMNAPVKHFIIRLTSAIGHVKALAHWVYAGSIHRLQIPKYLH